MIAELARLDIALLLATAGAYAYVGWATSRRQIGGEARLAAALFAVWWYTLAVLTFSGVGTRVLIAAGVLDIAIHATILHLVLLGLCGALWALQYYLTYLFSGSRKWFAPITLYYAALYVALLYLVLWRQATGVDLSSDGATLAYAREASGGVAAALGAALIAPTVAGAIGYARLFFRVHEPTQRYRIGLVSFTIIAWFGSSLVAIALRVTESEWWPDVSRMISLSAAIVILAAFKPPGFVRRRWGIRAVDEPPAEEATAQPRS